MICMFAVPVQVEYPLVQRNRVVEAPADPDIFIVMGVLSNQTYLVVGFPQYPEGDW